MVHFLGATSAPRPRGWDDLCSAAHDAAGDPVAALRLAPVVADMLPPVGFGRTLQAWQAMAELGAIDLSVARAVEPHLDAVGILAQAAVTSGDDETVTIPDETTWGVFAAEGPNAHLEALGDAGDFVLNGRKPWCSLARHLDRALVTAWTSSATRRLFAVDLRHEGVRAVDAPWTARGLQGVVSVPLDFDAVPATPVGEDGWYLHRPGFAWGGIGVAAVWWGGAAGIVSTMLRAAKQREPDQVARMLLGQADASLHAAAAVLGHAAHDVDSGGLQGRHAWPETLRIRAIVHDACETVLRCAAHGLGPGPLTSDEEHARRVSDLEVYLRQHKAERDAAVVGEGLIAGMPSTWT